MAKRDRLAIAVAAATCAVVGLALVAGAEVGSAPPPPPAAGAPPPVPAAPAAASPTVKIIFITVPMKKAFVSWGKKRLGMIAPHAPLIIERPRDSGPLDVVVRADGYIPVQTRAYTFGDSKVAVKLTPPDQKNTLLGYREEIPPEDGGVEPGSAPPSAAGPTTLGGPDGGAR